MTYDRWGALCYLAWGVIHAVIGAGVLVGLAQGEPEWVRAILADRAAPGAFSGLDPAVGGIIGQHAFNLMTGGLIAAAIALRLNWRGSGFGYWVNLVLISALDIGFILFVVGPGHIALGVGLVGPMLWIAGATLTTVARMPRLGPARN